MQLTEGSAEPEVKVVCFLRMVHSSIIECGIDEIIPRVKSGFIKIWWLSIITPQIIKWLALIEALLQ
jgi:hypothetical protein